MIDKRNKDTSTLKDCIDKMIDVYRLRQKYNETSIITSWGKVMGAAIASRTLKVFIRDKKLYVKLSSSPLRNELSMSRSKIIELLNKDFEKRVIEEVIFI
ncbi:MAG TPA: DUF721 domain-containing protein [Cytophagaceae bacterium]|jgi:predicted nucleic acid-binding Zn ribbon protein